MDRQEAARAMEEHYALHRASLDAEIAWQDALYREQRAAKDHQQAPDESESAQVPRAAHQPDRAAEDRQYSLPFDGEEEEKKRNGQQVNLSGLTDEEQKALEASRNGELPVPKELQPADYLDPSEREYLMPSGDLQLYHIAKQAERIYDTEDGGHQAAQIRSLHDRAEDVLRRHFDREFPEGEEVDVDTYERFQEFAERALEAVRNPAAAIEAFESEQRHQEWMLKNPFAPNPNGPEDQPPKELTERAERAQARDASRERTDRVAALWETSLSDEAKTLRDWEERGRDRSQDRGLEM